MPPIIKHVLKKRTAPFIALILLAVTGTSLITGGTYLEGKLLDSLVYSHDRTLFVTLLLIILGIGLSRLIVSYFQNRIQILTRRRTILAMNRSILACLFTKKTLAILTWSPTTLSSRINDDVNEIVGFFADTVVRLIGIIVSTVTIALYVMKADAKIFGMMAIFVPIYFVIYVVFHQKIYAISLRVKNKQNEYFTARNDFIGRYIEIKGAGSFQNEAKRLNRVEAGLFQTYIRDFWIRFTMSASQISIQLIFQTCFFLVGGFAVLNGQITIGFFSIILQYFSQLLNSVDQLLTVAMGTEAYRASLARMRQILSIAPDEKGTGQVNEIHTIEVKGFNVRRFSQQPSNDEMFYAKNMNVSFRTPGLYVISGDNGVGKTTFVRTITGIYQPEMTGDVLINGLNAAQVDLTKVRREQIGFLFQDVPSPHLTVGEYLADDCRNVAAFLNEEPKHFTQVFHSPNFNIFNLLDKKVDILSSGELQLVRLLKALSKEHATTYVLDEPTANIYPEIKADVIHLLQELAKTRLVIAITHDDQLAQIGTPISMR